jgi:hypothetical protein
VLVMVAAGWVFISWRRKRKLPTAASAPPALTPGVHVIQSQRGTRSWKGTVLDAHDMVPLAGVRVVVRAPTLEGDGVIHDSTTDRHGMFAFDLDERPEGAEIVASSATHAEERKELPPGGTLRVALITRRRSLLRRMVSWARVRGKPYDVSERDDVRGWAGELEAAAFGPAPVDDGVEARIRDKEPRP